MTNSQGAQQPEMLEDVMALEDVPDMPEWLKERIARRVATSQYYRGWKAEDAKPGQVWAVALPEPLYDNIIPDEVVMPIVFLVEFIPENTMENSEDYWYGYLCLPRLPKMNRPMLWHEAPPFVWGADLSDGDPVEEPPIDAAAEYVILMATVGIPPAWLASCVADYGKEGVSRSQAAAYDWLSRGGPAIGKGLQSEMGGVNIMDMMFYIKDQFGKFVHRVE